MIKLSDTNTKINGFNQNTNNKKRKEKKKKRKMKKIILIMKALLEGQKQVK